MVALPAGAATRAAPPVTHGASTPSFAAEVASLQGHTVTLSSGATCTVSASTCTVVTSGTSAISSGTVLALAPTGARESHGWLGFIGNAFASVGLAVVIFADPISWPAIGFAGAAYGWQVYTCHGSCGGPW